MHLLINIIQGYLRISSFPIPTPGTPVPRAAVSSAAQSTAPQSRSMHSMRQTNVAVGPSQLECLNATRPNRIDINGCNSDERPLNRHCADALIPLHYRRQAAIDRRRRPVRRVHVVYRLDTRIRRRRDVALRTGNERLLV